MQELKEKGYLVTKMLGKGGSSTCYLVYSAKYNQNFVCKIVENKNLYLNEIKYLSMFTHPNIVKLYDRFETESAYFLIIEYCNNGTVEDLIQISGGIKMNSLISFAEQVVAALEILHKKGVAHMDVKPGNFFIDSHSRIKLADFGLSQMSGQKANTSLNGTYAFIAPEVLLNTEGYDPTKADMWSLGVSLYYMTFGKLPWKHILSIKEDIILGVYNIPKGADSVITNIIRNCIKVNPDERLTIYDVRKLMSEISPSKSVASSFRKASHNILKMHCPVGVRKSALFSSKSRN